MVFCFSISTILSVPDWKGIQKPGVRLHSRRAGHFGRRLESADPASCLVVLLDAELLSAFDALDATLADVLTEFLAT